MRSFAWGCCCAVVVACGKGSDSAADSAAKADSAAATMAPAPVPTGLALADLAGKWDMRSIPESGDTTATVYELTTTADTTGWTITFPNRPPVAMRVLSVAGDSVVVEAGPYESARRKGVQVTTNGVMRLQGGRLVGTTVAHYSVKTADSVLTLRTEGSRKP
jgi:hypothetical protein